MSELGKYIWVFPDAFLPAKGNPYKTTSHGDQFGHESLCIANYSSKKANLTIDFLYEDQEPIENFQYEIEGKRSLHLRLDHIQVEGKSLPREKPYSIILKSSLKVVAQLSRLDTTSEHNAFMTAMGWGTDV
ncbi:MAG: sensory rhodopsin transducer [Tamlana sp.]